MIKIAVKALFLGIITAIAAIIIEQIIAILGNIFFHVEIITSFYQQITAFIVVAVLVEETLKYLALFSILRERLHVRGGRLLFSSIFLGIGWAIVEIYLITLSRNYAFSQILTASNEQFFSVATVAIVHIVTTFLIAILISGNYFDRPLKTLKIILFPAGLHVLYNFLIIQKGGFTPFLVISTLSLMALLAIILFLIKFRELD